MSGPITQQSYLTILDKDKSIDFGTITSVTDTLTKSVATTPIVSLRTECTFAIESSTGMKYSYSFVRRCPSSVNDQSSNSTQWSNSHWIDEASRLVNRWQTKTGGYHLTFIAPYAMNNYPMIDEAQGKIVYEQVYITDLRFKYAPSTSDVIQGTISVSVGGLHPSDKIGQSGYIDGVPKDYIYTDAQYVRI